MTVGEGCGGTPGARAADGAVPETGTGGAPGRRTSGRRSGRRGDRGDTHQERGARRQFGAQAGRGAPGRFHGGRPDCRRHHHHGGKLAAHRQGRGGAGRGRGSCTRRRGQSGGLQRHAGPERQRRHGADSDLSQRRVQQQITLGGNSRCQPDQDRRRSKCRCTGAGRRLVRGRVRVFWLCGDRARPRRRGFGPGCIGRGRGERGNRQRCRRSRRGLQHWCVRLGLPSAIQCFRRNRRFEGGRRGHMQNANLDGSARSRQRQRQRRLGGNQSRNRAVVSL